MKCDRCHTREAAVPYKTVEEGQEREIQLCLPCVSTFVWDTKGELTRTDLANLGFAPQPGEDQVLDDVRKARLEGKLRTKEDAMAFAGNHPALRIRPSDVRFQTFYVPVAGWNLCDSQAHKEQPGFEEQVHWWKAERDAGRMVMYGIAIDRPPGMVMVGWTCTTLEEAERLAGAAPWVRRNVLAVLKTAAREKR